jgi:hypothetical protein
MANSLLEAWLDVTLGEAAHKAGDDLGGIKAFLGLARSN